MQYVGCDCMGHSIVFHLHLGHWLTRWTVFFLLPSLPWLPTASTATVLRSLREATLNMADSKHVPGTRYRWFPKDNKNPYLWGDEVKTQKEWFCSCAGCGGHSQKKYGSKEVARQEIGFKWNSEWGPGGSYLCCECNKDRMSYMWSEDGTTCL